MTPHEEVLLELSAKRSRIEKDLTDARRLVTNTAHELEGARTNLHNCEDRMTHLLSAFEYMRTEAEVVSITEYQKVRDLIEKNKVLVEQYEGLADSAKKRGTGSAEYVKTLVEQLDLIDKEFNSYGKVLYLPSQRQGPVDEEGTDDDDS